MNTLKNLVHEIHRRSLWQVLGIFLAASWGVLQVVEVLTETAGLPDWTPTMALVLLMVGLPVCLATAFVQEGMSDRGGTRRDDTGAPAAFDRAGGEGTTPPDAGTAPVNLSPGTGSLDHPSTRIIGTRRFLTWRNAVLGGIGAFTLLGFSLVAYFVMWTTGVGPVGNLVAQGVIEEGDPVLLADFENNTNDAALGGVVTEALRVDLAQTQAITLVEPGAVDEILELMGREPNARVEGDVADEIAARGGYSAIIEGEVGSAGSGYIFVATLRSATSGQTLATFRRTASDDDGVIAAIDGLSQDIRERAGESLRSIRAGEPLDAVTTSSLEALRLYSEADVVRDRGDQIRASALIDEALRLDPEFAMAWRMKSVLLQQAGAPRPEVRAAATRAYELRDRLSERERLYTTAMYHNYVTEDLEEQSRAYEMVLADFPEDRNALNNLSIVYSDRTRWEEASALLEQAVGGMGTSFSAYANRPLYYALGGQYEEAQRALAELEEKYPASEVWPNWGGFILGFSSWDVELARERALELQNVPDGISWRRTGTRALGLTSAMTGEMAAAREVIRGAGMEAQRNEDWNDAAVAWLDLARAEHLVGTGDATPHLEFLLQSGIVERMEPRNRPNWRLIEELAWAGMDEEAGRYLEEWRADAAEVQGTAIRTVAAFSDAFADRADDPLAAARALEILRRNERCDRCWSWELGTLFEEAGMWQEAFAERQRSLEAGQDFWFGMHRLASEEALGRIHEQLGNTEQAIAHYRTYVEQLSDGPDLPRVARARGRLAALGAAN